MAALNGLKWKWEAKIGPIKPKGLSIPTSVAENPWDRGFSLARRNINPTRRPIPMIEPPLPGPDRTSLADAPPALKEMTPHPIEAAPNPNLHRGPSRFLVWTCRGLHRLVLHRLSNLFFGV
ncbi:UNVERIFIED_CONTAM: hypothetical protein Slati_0884900 [Sesamum latifolium]|uniref:Uncharacterized protein n=1 Tax=Sesamum latifolium TaxID=2727402 RepID=A0AAW2XMV8_9LAMI